MPARERNAREVRQHLQLLGKDQGCSGNLDLCGWRILDEGCSWPPVGAQWYPSKSICRGLAYYTAQWPLLTGERQDWQEALSPLGGLAVKSELLEPAARSPSPMGASIPSAQGQCPLLGDQASEALFLGSSSV